MSTTRLFENFSMAQREAATVFLPGGKIDEVRKAARLEGYKLGFQEANAKADAAHSEATRAIAATFQDYGFSQTEARRAILESLRPLVEQLVNVVLPEVARVGLADLITHQLSEIASSVIESPVILRCPEANHLALENLVASCVDLTAEIVVISDSNLGANEIRISSTNSERHVDIDHAIVRVRDSISEFYKSLDQKSA